MNDQQLAALTESEAADSAKPEPVNATQASVATSDQLKQTERNIEERMTKFERSSIRLAWVAVGISALAAIFVCLQWHEMHSSSGDTHNLTVAAGNQAIWTQNLATNMQAQADRTRDLADTMKEQ